MSAYPLQRSLPSCERRGSGRNRWDCFLFFTQLSVIFIVRLYLHFILTMSLEECQTKSFEMNLLLHAIFKFFTTKR